MARHVHADLYEEAVNDLSIKWQCELEPNDWQDVAAWRDVVTFHPSFNYRKKPREFKEGHWYKCIHNGNPAVVRYKDAEFDLDGYVLFDSDFSWIGESLGKLKFG